MNATALEPTTTATGGKPYTAPPRQIWGWAVGRVAEFGMVSTFGQASNIFSVGFGLNPVILGWCMMLPRVVDGILDPMIGHWSDDTHSRWGRRKPFLIVGAFLGALFLASLWWTNPHWSPAAQFVYLGLIGCCLYLCYGTYTMAWTAIGYELSDDYHERAKVAAIGGFVLAIVALSNNWIYWLALRPAFGGVIWGIRWIGGITAVLVAVSALATALMTRERFSHVSSVRVSILPALRTTLSNRPFVILLLMKGFDVFGGRLAGGILFYISVYYVCQGDQSFATKLIGIGATLGTVWNLAMLPLVKPASRLIGKRGALIFGGAVGFAAAIAMPFITTPEHPYLSLIPNLVVTPLLVISTTIIASIVPDICDLDELQSGQRREGLFTSVLGFVAKLEISVVIVLVGYIVSWSSVDTKIGPRWEATIDDKEEEVAGFKPGEAAVFGFKEEQAVTFDAFFALSSRNNGSGVGEFELLAGDESSSAGFHPLGTFRVQSGTLAGYQEFKFESVTAKYFKIRLLSAQAGGASIDLPEIRLVNERGISPGVNLLAASQGGKMLAAQPPVRAVNTLFWLAMVPNIAFTGLVLLMALLFPLTEVAMEEVRRQLDARRLAKAAAGEPTDEVAEQFIQVHPEMTREVESSGLPAAKSRPDL